MESKIISEGFPKSDNGIFQMIMKKFENWDVPLKERVCLWKDFKEYSSIKKTLGRGGALASLPQESFFRRLMEKIFSVN